MFEGKISEGQLANARTGDSGEEALQDLSWADLAARLAAARDLRQSLPRPEVPKKASFHPASARRIVSDEGKSKQGVNPDDLGHGNQDGANDVGSPHDTLTDSRGN